MKHILDPVYDFLVIRMLVARAAVCQGCTDPVIELSKGQNYSETKHYSI